MHRATRLLQNHKAIHFHILFIYVTPQEPQLMRERTLNSKSDPMGLCQQQKSLGHEHSKLCNVQKKGKFPVSLREPFPEGLRIAENGKTLWVITSMNQLRHS